MMMLLSCIYRFTVNKMILNNQGSLRRTNERHDENEAGRNCEYSKNLNQMIFYVQYEHMMNLISELIGFLQILRG